MKAFQNIQELSQEFLQEPTCDNTEIFPLIVHYLEEISYIHTMYRDCNHILKELSQIGKQTEMKTALSSLRKWHNLKAPYSSKIYIVFITRSFNKFIYMYGSTHYPLYNTIHYSMILDITQFKDRSQKCTDYIEK